MTIQALVQLDVQGDSFAPEAARFIDEDSGPARSRSMAGELIRAIWEHRQIYDQWIGRTVRHWELSRIAAVDRAILRLAVHELLDRAQVPPKVAIDEAVELAKTFSTKESPQFVNGVLDGILTCIKKQGGPQASQGQGDQDQARQEKPQEPRDNSSSEVK